ncbi:hypothetical protein [Ensifer soli]|uniref:hypothetical protein n=1 Tax=Ciceribacter sp. sgz301302 TaxID=3342379 RepID=UPI0035B716AC
MTDVKFIAAGVARARDAFVVIFGRHAFPSECLGVSIERVDGSVMDAEFEEVANPQGEVQRVINNCYTPTRKHLATYGNLYSISIPITEWKTVRHIRLTLNTSEAVPFYSRNVSLEYMTVFDESEFESFFTYQSRRNIDSFTTAIVARNNLERLGELQAVNPDMACYAINCFVILAYKAVELSDTSLLTYVREKLHDIRSMEALVPFGASIRQDPIQMQISLAMAMTHVHIHSNDVNAFKREAGRVVSAVRNQTPFRLTYGLNVSLAQVLLAVFDHYHGAGKEDDFHAVMDTLRRSVSADTDVAMQVRELQSVVANAYVAKLFVQSYRTGDVTPQTLAASLRDIAPRVNTEAFRKKMKSFLLG